MAVHFIEQSPAVVAVGDMLGDYCSAVLAAHIVSVKRQKVVYHFTSCFVHKVRCIIMHLMQYNVFPPFLVSGVFFKLVDDLYLCAMKGHTCPAFGFSENISYLLKGQLAENAQGKHFFVGFLHFMKDTVYFERLRIIGYPVCKADGFIGNVRGDLLFGKSVSDLALVVEDVFGYLTEPAFYTALPFEFVKGFHCFEKSFLGDLLRSVVITGKCFYVKVNIVKIQIVELFNIVHCVFKLSPFH